MTLTSANYIACNAGDPAAADAPTEQPGQTGLAGNSERVQHAERLLADGQEAAPADAPSDAANGSVISAALTGARLNLRHANEAVTAAGAELALAQQPAARLRAIAAGAERIAADLAAHQARDADTLSEWLLGRGLTPRPETSPETLTSNAN
jgi:hypothetical protein